MEVLGALNPLKTVKDGITENREINREREEARLFDERERQRQSMEHELAMAVEQRQTEQMRLAHKRQMAEVQIEAKKTQAQLILSLMAHLPDDQKSIVAVNLIQRMVDNVESISSDARLGEVRMLETGGQTPTEDAS
jgi:hypothetical protein